MKVQAVTMTPQWAEKLLLANTRNRSFKRRNVELFCSEIRAGRWKLNGETIKVGTDGQLLDGQNRLLSVVETGIPILTLLATDVPPDVFDTIDTGAMRSAGDTLTVAGETNGRNLAAALVVADNLLNGRTDFIQRERISNAEILAKLERHPDLRKSLRWAKPMTRLAPASLTVALHYVFSKTSQTKAEQFFMSLSDGAGLSTDSPVYLLRSRLIDNAMAKGKLTRRYTAALFIKAWRAYIDGRTVKNLRFREVGDSPEAFPSL